MYERKVILKEKALLYGNSIHKESEDYSKFQR